MYKPFDEPKADPQRVARRPGTGAWLAYGLACALAVLPLLDKASVAAGVSAAGLVLLGAACLWRLARSAPAPQVAGAAAGPAAPALDTLLSQVLPVWRQHVGTVRQQTDDAVGSLVTSLSSISDQFEAAGFRTGDAADDNATADLLAACQHTLEPLIATMNGVAAGRDAMAGNVQQLGATAADLQSMADDVARIAQQTNLLAINAAIEAARAGDAGRGFAVVAAEVRRLSQDSADTARRINERISQVSAIMARTSQASLQAAEQDRHAIAQSGQAVQQVLGHVGELGQAAQAMRERGRVIRADLETLIVSLQFQDRVSQVITAVDDDMDRLHRSVETAQPLPPAPQWLQELQRSYTMRDQRQAHRADDGAAAPAAPSARKVVFF
jgi:methyl-accepting chemotaxis protein